MKKYMELPADYAVLSDDEMTYTTGGSAVGGVVTIVGVAVLASSYVWGISQARDWLSVDSNRRGNPLTVMGRAMDAISDDMSKSPSNFLRDVVSTGTVVALAPRSALLLILEVPLWLFGSFYLSSNRRTPRCFGILFVKECYYGKHHDAARFLLRDERRGNDLYHRWCQCYSGYRCMGLPSLCMACGRHRYP